LSKQNLEMMKKIMLMFAIAALLGSCKKEENKPLTYKMEVTSTIWGTTTYGKHKLTVTAKNTGTGTCYNTKVTYFLNTGDSGNAYPGNLNDIPPGQIVTDDVIFFNSPSTSSVTVTTGSIEWLNR